MQHPLQLTIGIDLGGTSTRVGIYDCDMKQLTSRSFKTRVSDGPQSCVDEMAAVIDQLLAESGTERADIRGVGIGSPGPINLRTGVLGSLPNLPGWDNYPLRTCLAETTGLPVVLESDANAAAIAEWKLGAGKETGLDSMAMITLGTGVGSGLVLGGRIWHGMFGMGGEVGHTTVEHDGLVCGCGTRGCLEMYASANGVRRIAAAVAKSDEGTAALRRLLEQDEFVTAHSVGRLAHEEDDPAARLVFERLGFYLGLGIANLISTLDLPMIVVGGGVAQSWPLFAPALFRTVHQYSVVYRLATPKQQETMEADHTYIRPAVLGDAAGLIGAALLPWLNEMPQQAHHSKPTQMPDMAETLQ
jgi:glucokinase